MDPQREQRMQTAVGYWLSKALSCAARAGVADALRDGPRPVAELARAAGVDAESLHLERVHVLPGPTDVVEARV